MCLNEMCLAAEDRIEKTKTRRDGYMRTLVGEAKVGDFRDVEMKIARIEINQGR